MYILSSELLSYEIHTYSIVLHLYYHVSQYKITLTKTPTVLKLCTSCGCPILRGKTLSFQVEYDLSRIVICRYQSALVGPDQDAEMLTTTNLLLFQPALISNSIVNSLGSCFLLDRINTYFQPYLFPISKNFHQDRN